MSSKSQAGYAKSFGANEPPLRLEDCRRQLAEQQARFIKALMSSENGIDGIDRRKLMAASDALGKKRYRASARAWPQLVRALGVECQQMFSQYAKKNKLPNEGGPLADGRAFADYLEQAGEFPDEARPERFTVDLRYKQGKNGLRRRCGLALKVGHFNRRLVVGVTLPFLGEYWFQIPWK